MARRSMLSTTAKRSPPKRGCDIPSLRKGSPGERRQVFGRGLACRQEPTELLFRRIFRVVHACGDRDKHPHGFAIDEDGTRPQQFCLEEPGGNSAVHDIEGPYQTVMLSAD